VALSTIYPNEQIIADKFGAAGKSTRLTIPDGNIAISVTLSDTGRVAGFVAPGNDVAIFAVSSPSGGGDTTRLLLPKVQVIAIGDTTVASAAEDPATPSASPQTLVTLSVNQVQAEKVMYAASHGELSFALLNDKSKVAPGPGVDASNLFKG
jgi:pilus assembly protein CpaB